MYIDHPRRRFIKQTIAGAAALAGLQVFHSCEQKKLSEIKGSLKGANSKAGHVLRDGKQVELSGTRIETDILIVGGGIAGLSARRWLKKSGVQHVLTLELDDRVGGNSTFGRNEVSAYPWGAHYLPVADIGDSDLVGFLVEAGVITGFDDNNLPVYSDYYLCHDPEERLFINGYWQEGLVPVFGIGVYEQQEQQRFFAKMDAYRMAVGKDGKDAFKIPVDTSSSDEEYRSLDNISFADWLRQNNFTAPSLLWYLEYGCKDDYGSNLENTSAWAGIHYFASRKGKASNADHTAVLTWPEGNGFLMNKLREQADSEILTNSLAYSFRYDEVGIVATVYDTGKNTAYEIAARKVILATPQFVNKKLLSDLLSDKRTVNYIRFEYAPWVVANLTLDALPDVKGMPLCWDNVLYRHPSVGYVNANHQDISQSTKRVLTYYKPLIGQSYQEERRKAYGRSYDSWKEQIIQEMEYAHKGISSYIDCIDIWVWGHGMIVPQPNFIWGEDRANAQKPVDDTIFFAHSDLSGISIFEEAFYQGIKAAAAVLASL